jgi:hypothetical protein
MEIAKIKVSNEATGLAALVKEFISLLDITEESDSGNEFKPNRISSCRVMDGERMEKLLAEMKGYI